MGGAFVGVADDWTATFWNPAGLAQLQGSGVGFSVNQLFTSTSEGDSMANPTPPFTHTNIVHGDTFINLGGEPSRFNATMSHMSIPLPALGAYQRWGKWVAALSVHTPLGFSEEIQDDTVPGLSVDFKSKGYTIMSGLSAATECLPGFYVGGGVHVLTSELERHATKVGPGFTFESNAEGTDSATPQGVVGLLYRLNPKVRLGAVYRTPATLHLSGRADVSDTRFQPTTPSSPFQDEASHFTQDLYVPATYGVGLAYEPSAQWLVAADWQGTDWRPTRTKLTFDSPGVVLQNQDFDAGWGFTNRVRLGGEYRPATHWAYRVGVTRDPQAMPDEAQSLTNLVDITRYFFTSGIGWSSSRNIDINLAYQFGWGQKNINGVEFVRRSHAVLLDTTFRFL